MNVFEYAIAYNNFSEEINSITDEAVDLAAKVFGCYPINNTINEINNPSAVCLEHAIFCQELLNCK